MKLRQKLEYRDSSIRKNYVNVPQRGRNKNTATVAVPTWLTESFWYCRPWNVSQKYSFLGSKRISLKWVKSCLNKRKPVCHGKQYSHQHENHNIWWPARVNFSGPLLFCLNTNDLDEQNSVDNIHLQAGDIFALCSLHLWHGRGYSPVAKGLQHCF